MNKLRGATRRTEQPYGASTVWNRKTQISNRHRNARSVTMGLAHHESLSRSGVVLVLIMGCEGAATQKNEEISRVGQEGAGAAYGCPEASQPDVATSSVQCGQSLGSSRSAGPSDRSPESVKAALQQLLMASTVAVGGAS